MQPCASNSGTNTQFGRWVRLPGNGNTWDIGVDASEEAGDAQFSVYTCSAGMLSCVAGSNANQEFAGYDETLRLNTLAGESYYIFVNTPTVESGQFMSMMAFDLSNCPANRSCLGAESISCGETMNGNTTGLIPFPPEDPCGDWNAGTEAGLWYDLIGTGYDMTVSIDDANFDTQMAIYRSICSNPVCVDGQDLPGIDGGESITFESKLGREYKIYVDGTGSEEGEFEILVDCEPGCPAGFLLECNYSVTAPLTEYQYRPDLVSCSASISVDGPGFWVRAIGTGEMLSFGMNGSADMNLNATLFECTGNTIDCLTAVDANDYTGVFEEVLNFPSTLGVEYHLYISSGDSEDLGKFFNVRLWGTDDCPGNFSCAFRQEISCGETVSGDITNANTPIDGPQACAGAADGFNPGLYYEFIGDGNEMTIQTKNADFDTQLAVYIFVDCDNLSCIDGADALGVGAGELITIDTNTGWTYLVYVDGWQDDRGSFELELSCNETCPSDISDIGCNSSLTAPLTSSPSYLNIPSCDPNINVEGYGRWVSFTGTGGQQQIGLGTATDNDFQLSIYQCIGNDLICFNAYDDNEELGGWNSEFVNFSTIEGEDYFAWINPKPRFDQDTGDYFSIAIYSDSDCPANKNCELAKRIQCGETLTGNTTGNVGAPTATACGPAGDGNKPGLYYSVIGNGNDITVSLSSADFDTQLTVYNISTCNLFNCLDGADIVGTDGESITFSSIANVEYRIYVDGSNDQTGEFDISINCPDPCPNPSYTYSCNSTTSTFLLGLPLVPTSLACTLGTETNERGFWAGLTGHGKNVTVGIASNSDIDYKVNVYTCSGNGLVCLDSFDDNRFLSGWNKELITFPTIDGEEYFLLITSDDDEIDPSAYFSTGAFFEGDCSINSRCSFALELPCDEPVVGDISGAGSAFDQPTSCGGGADGTQQGLWYRWIGTGEEVTAKILASGTNFDTQLSIYDGPICDFPEWATCIGGADVVSDNGGEELTFDSVLGREYSIYIDGWSNLQGVFELLLECNPGVSVDIEILMEGPYLTGGLMSDDLGDLIPLNVTDVYGGVPYNYTGSESLPSIPDGMVDWVLVEARTGTPDPTNTTRGTTTVQTVAGILQTDGHITGTDGLPLRFTIDASTPHYYAVRHRNHLDVLSGLSFTGTLQILNFRTSILAAFGAEQLKPSGDGFAYMHAGDYVADHVIQTTDFDLWQEDPAVLNDYRQADGNLDGVIQTTDFDEWNKNKAKIGSIEVSY